MEGGCVWDIMVGKCRNIYIGLPKEDWQYIIDNLNYILRKEPEYKDLILLRDKLIKGIS